MLTMNYSLQLELTLVALKVLAAINPHDALSELKN